MSASVDLGPLDQVPVGQGRCFVVNGGEVAVFRRRDGTFRAVDNRCPHRAGPLADGIIGGDVVICPLHAHKFNLDTGAGSEKHECVRVFPVSVEDDRIILSIPMEAAA